MVDGVRMAAGAFPGPDAVWDGFFGVEDCEFGFLEGGGEVEE